MHHSTRIARRFAGFSLLYLGGSLAVTFPVMFLLSTVAPQLSERLGRSLFLGVMALLCGGGGALWGVHLARLISHPHPDARRWALGGAAGYGASAPFATYVASTAETYLLESAQRGVGYPMHLAFALIFGCVLLLVVGLTSFALALASRRGALGALAIAGAAAGSGVGSFLAVDLAFDLAGWRVGAPGAELRSTMLVVLGAGLLVATVAAGAVLGRLLSRSSALAAPTAAARVSADTLEPAR